MNTIYTDKNRQITFNKTIVTVITPSIEKCEDGSFKPLMVEEKLTFLSNSDIELESLKKSNIKGNSIIVNEESTEVKYTYSTAQLLSIATLQE